MKAYLLEKPGSFKKMKMSKCAIPKVRAGEIRVKVEAVGLNPVDYKLAERGIPQGTYPVIPGLDAAGVVNQVSKSETRWKPGDRVYFHGNKSNCGAFAEYALCASHAASKIPDDLSFIEAAALPCAGWTAYQALVKRLKITPGSSILILGGSGGVGSYAVQIASNFGLNVIATCSGKNADFVTSMGASHIIDYNKDNIQKSVMKITEHRGVEFILDTVSSESALDAMGCLSYQGKIACVAGLPDLKELKPFTLAPEIHEIALGSVYGASAEAQKQLSDMGEEFAQMVVNGAVHPPIESVVGFDQIVEGLERIAGRHVRGKIVATVGAESEKSRISDIRWQGAPAPDDVRAPLDPPDAYWNAISWEDLTKAEKQLWKDLGWSAKSWKGEKAPPKTYNTGWKFLSKEERQSASKLGYSKSSWNP